MNDSKINSLADRLGLWWLSLLLLTAAQQCAYRLSPLEMIPADEITARRQALQALMPLSGEGQVKLEHHNSTVGTSFQFQFQSLDSLLLLVSDPLGRQLARIELYGDEYQIHLLRENRLFSGSQPPELIRQYLPLTLTAAQLRNLLLGLPFNPAGEKQTMRGRFVDHKTGLKTLQVPESLSIHYSDFKPLAGIALARQIWLRLPLQKLEVSIQLTNIQGAGLKFSSN